MPPTSTRIMTPSMQPCLKSTVNSYMHAERGNTSDTIMIFSDEVMVENGSKVYVHFKSCSTFWEDCSEDDIKTPQQLKLYRSCCLMLPCNKNVGDGQANGTRVTLERVVLKPNESTQTVLINGNIPVSAVHASQVA